MFVCCCFFIVCFLPCYSFWANKDVYIIPRVQFFIISYFDFGFTSAYNSILFCCLRRNVEPCCHTHDSRSTVIVYSTRPRLVGLAPWVIARGAWWSNTRIKQKAGCRCDIQPRCSSYWSQSQIFVENRDISLPHLHSTPPLTGFPVGILPSRLVWKN